VTERIESFALNSEGRISIYQHALRLPQVHGAAPHAEQGNPLPDEVRYRESMGSRGRRHDGPSEVQCLEEYLSGPLSERRLRQLADALVEVEVNRSGREWIVGFAGRSDPVLLRRAGRWLVRNAHDRVPVTVGLALLVETAVAGDAQLLRTIGLLEPFRSLAGVALERLPDGVGHLMWLADHTYGWGRPVGRLIDHVEDLRVREWLLRRADNGDELGGYVAALLVEQARVDVAIADPQADPEVVDHTGRVLFSLARCLGMGPTLADLPVARRMLADYLERVAALPQTVERLQDLSMLLIFLYNETGDDQCLAIPWEPGELEGMRAKYEGVLRRPGWRALARRQLDGLAEDELRFRGYWLKRWLTMPSGVPIG
jgi:hypothetical protein